MINEFLKLVKERHNPSINRKKPECPYCGSKNTNVKRGTETLVGYMPGGPDGNHHWDEGQCLNCNKTFSVEWKQYRDEDTKKICDHVWIVDPETQKVLAGIPGCFESYVYTCSHCGGEVKRKYYNKDSDIKTTILSSRADEFGNWINEYDIYFECQSCEEKIKATNSYYWHKEPKKSTTKPKKKLLENWEIKEEIGITYENTEAFKRINLKD